jgi:hypothetical protein
MYPQQCYRPGHKELFHVKPSDLFLAKNRQMATQFSESGTFCRKFLVFEKKILQKVTENWFFGDGVTTFMPTGHSFQNFLNKFAS